MLKILIADDHELLRHGVCRLLESQPGWKVVCQAANGIEAVRLAAQLRPEIAILDLAMPGVNGLTAASQIAQCSPETAVLIFTLHHSEQVTREILASGARGYVLKSDAGDELVAAVEIIRTGRFAYPFHAHRVLTGAAALRSRRTGAVGDLSPRELEILCLVAAGSSNKDIAFDLGISMKTVETHRSHMMDKLSLTSLAELIHFAIRNELVNSWDVDSLAPSAAARALPA